MTTYANRFDSIRESRKSQESITRSRSNSPATCDVVPVPNEARLAAPGLALAYAMSSPTVLGANDGLETITKGKSINPATGAMSRRRLNERLPKKLTLTAAEAAINKSV